VLLKYRFKKHYRHAALDALLTRQRLNSEARALVRCSKAGVCVPGLRIVDVKQGVLGLEWIDGWSVRELLGGGQEDDETAFDDDATVEDDEIADEEGLADEMSIAALGIAEGSSSLKLTFAHSIP
jgi:TP53 regulating kinase-like protein